MSFSIIAAIAANNVIGNKNKLPWHIPQELEHFYKTVYGKPVVMGRKTFESIGKPIVNSENYVLSHNPTLQLKGYKIVHSIDSILKLYPQNIEVMIIGGASIYRQFLPFVNKMYLTIIDHKFDGDSYFPQWNFEQWKIVNEVILQTNSYPCRFVTLEKIL